MAIFRSLTIQSGVWRQIQDTNSLGVGAGIDTASGINLTITAGASAVISLASNTTLQAGLNLSGAAGSGAVDFSLLTGVFKTSTGVNTFGGSSHLFASSLDASTATTWAIGGTNATTLSIGRTGQQVHFLGNVLIDGTETVVGITTFQAQTTFQGPVTVGDGTGVDTLDFDPVSGRLGSATNPDVQWLKETAHSFHVAASTTTNAAGALLNIAAGQGNGTGAGGILTLRGGGSGTGATGNGSIIALFGGDANSTLGNGGSVQIDGGAKTGAGVGGQVLIGTSALVTSAVNIGHSAITTTITGGLTQLTGAVSLTGNAASSLTTSAGALTLTSAAAATWSTAAGNLTVTGAANLNLTSGTGPVTVNGFTGIDLQKNGTSYMDVGITTNNVVTIVKGLTQSGGPFSLTGLTASTLNTAAGNLTVDAFATLKLGTSTATAVEIGSATANTKMMGILEFDPTNGRLGSSSNPNILWTKELNHEFTVDDSTSTNTVGGKLTVRSGAGFGAASGGALALTAHNSGSGATGNGGAITIQAGSALSTNGNGGNVNIFAGAFSGTGTGGNIVLSGGVNNASLTLKGQGMFNDPRSAKLLGGDGSTGQYGGAIFITGGVGDSNTGGNISIDAGVGNQAANGTIFIGTTTALEVQIGVSNTQLIFGGGGVSITVQAGSTLATTGSGNINLPNNGSARFKIETVAVSANVTSANLGTLTAGPASNADALHTHAGGAASSVISTGLTTTGNASGDGVYMSGTNTVSGTLATAFGTSKFVGVYGGTSGTITSYGVVTATFVGGAPAAGDQIFLSDATAGAFTKTAPTATGSYVAEVGIAFSATTFLIQVKPPVGPNP